MTPNQAATAAEVVTPALVAGSTLRSSRKTP